MDERSFLGEAVEVVKRMHSMPELQVEAKRFRVYAGNWIGCFSKSSLLEPIFAVLLLLEYLFTPYYTL